VDPAVRTTNTPRRATQTVLMVCLLEDSTAVGGDDE
jgi:hypothetical protein